MSPKSSPPSIASSAIVFPPALPKYDGQDGREGAAWRRIYALLRTCIRDGTYGSGERLPAEGDLAAHFKVNRHTVRRALDDLVRDGLVEKTRGRGSIVWFGQRLQLTLGSVPFLSDRYGFILDHLDAKTVEAGERLAGKLHLTARQSVLELSLLVLHSENPIGFCQLALPHARFATFTDVLRRERTMNSALAGYPLSDITVAGPCTITSRSTTDHEIGLLKTSRARSLLVIDQTVEARFRSENRAVPIYNASFALRGDAIELVSA